MKLSAPSREVLTLLCGVTAGMLLLGCRSAAPEGSSTKVSAKTVSASAPSSEALAHFSMGLLDELHTEPDAATTNFLLAIESDPDNEELYWLAAERLTVQSRKEEAMEVFDLLIKRKPKSESGYMWKGWLLQTMQESDLAEIQYRKAIRVAPKNLGAYMRLAQLLTSQKKWDDTAKILEKALRKVEEPMRAYELLGEVYQLAARQIEDDPGKAQKQLDRAIHTYTRGLKHYDQNRKFIYQLAMLKLRGGQTTEGLDLLTRFESFSPNNLQVKNELINSIRQAMGDADKAIEALQAYLAEHPANGQAAYYLAGLYEVSGNSEKAMQYYAQSASAAPDESAPIWKQSLLLVQATNLTQAVSLLQESLEALPDDVRLGEMLAFVELQQTNFAAAVESFAKVEGLLLEQGMQENMQNLWINYAIAAQQLGQLDLAAEKLIRAIEVNGESVPSFAQRMFRQTDRKKILHDGIVLYSKVIEQFPDNPYAHYHLALFHNYSQNFDAAAKAFRSTEEVIQEKFTGSELLNAGFYFLYAANTERSGNLDEAEALFFECIEKDPENAEAYNYLAYMWAENNRRLDKAMKYIDKSLAMDPENGAFLDTKGWIFYQQGDYPAALTLLEKANQLIPDDPTLMEHVADTLFKLERKDEARTLWEKALAQDPENEGLRKKLAESMMEEILPEPVDNADTNALPDQVETLSSNKVPEVIEQAAPSELEEAPQSNAVETIQSPTP